MGDCKRKISKADIILLVGIILLCGIVLIFFYVLKRPGLTADIMISGETVRTVSLDETAAYIIYSPKDASDENNIENYVVDGKGICIVKCNADETENLNVDSYNVIIVENGTLNIIDADCPDKVCVNHSIIENVGETIICLPHKLVVEIKER